LKYLGYAFALALLSGCLETSSGFVSVPPDLGEKTAGELPGAQNPEVRDPLAEPPPPVVFQGGGG